MITEQSPFESLSEYFSEKNKEIFLNKKSFKKFYFELYEKYSDYPNNEVGLEILNTKMRIFNHNVNILHKLFGDNVNYDLIMNHNEFLCTLFISDNFSNKSIEWIGKYITLNSFLNFISVKFEKNKFDETGVYNWKEFHTLSSDLSDMFNMIKQILDRNESIEPPTRLRFDDFHDYLAKVHLEATTKPVVYPKYFLKDSSYVKDNFEIIEPSGSIDLAKWATKVKNCVFSYADKILNGTSAIFLISENGKPTYTVEVYLHKQIFVSGKEKLNPEYHYAEKIYRSKMTTEEHNTVKSMIEEIIS